MHSSQLAQTMTPTQTCEDAAPSRLITVNVNFSERLAALKAINRQGRNYLSNWTRRGRHRCSGLTPEWKNRHWLTINLKLGMPKQLISTGHFCIYKAILCGGAVESASKMWDVNYGMYGFIRLKNTLMHIGLLSSVGSSFSIPTEEIL